VECEVVRARIRGAKMRVAFYKAKIAGGDLDLFNGSSAKPSSSMPASVTAISCTGHSHWWISVDVVAFL
jgi:hypothetical protein